MTYINFPLLKKSDISYEDYLMLVCIRQMRTEPLQEYLNDICKGKENKLKEFESKGLVEFIKKDAKKGLMFCVRTSKKANEFLDNLSIAEVTEADIILWDWLVKKYKRESLEIGNAKRGKRYVAQFRSESGISGNHLVLLCKTFINDSTQMEWSKRLEFLFFKPPNAFATRFDIEESKLYKYYLYHQTMFDKKFDQTDKVTVYARS